MKIILFGANGMLGNYLKTYLEKKYEVLNITRKDIDLSESDEFEIFHHILNENVSEEDVIINACGVIKQRNYEPVDMIKVNSLFPHILAKIKKDIGCNVIHITTDCVFSGNKGKYIETDLHDCIDDYGKSKSLGENPELSIIRTSIIGEELNNKKSLLEWVKSNKGSEINGYDNHLWNGVTCLELSKTIDHILTYKLFWNGVKHFYSPDTVSKFELVNMINDVYNLDITINKKETPVKCDRSLSSIENFCEIKKTLFEQLKELKNFKL